MPENNENNIIDDLDDLLPIDPQPDIRTTRIINAMRRSPVSFVEQGDIQDMKDEKVEEDPNRFVKHCKTKEEIKISEAANLYNIGWVRKTEPDIIKDYYSDYYLLNIINNGKQSAYLLFTKITEDGKLSDPHPVIPFDDIKYKTVEIGGIFDYEKSNLLLSFKKVIVPEELINDKTFLKYFKESIVDCKFYLKNNIDPSELIKRPKIEYRKVNKNIIYEKYNTVKKPNTYINTLGKRYSFGLEIETSSGILPYRFDKLIDYTAVHDGSLKDEDGHVYGGEYVTGVLRGDQGLLQTRLLTNELTKRCLLNVKCGVHVHLGDINFTKENITLMYYLYQNLQDEILSMFPPSRRDNRYCRKLSKLSINLSNIQSEYSYYIDHYYNLIIKLLSQRGECNADINKKKDHPKGHKCGYDHSAHRYCWVNFIPAVFNTRKNGIYTIEFRPHAASTSYKKIKNWLLICMALVDIVENHKSQIYNNPNLTLADIIKICYPKDHLVLNNYIEKRKIKFSSEEDHDLNETLDNEIESNLSIKNL